MRIYRCGWRRSLASVSLRRPAGRSGREKRQARRRRSKLRRQVPKRAFEPPFRTTRVEHENLDAARSRGASPRSTLACVVTPAATPRQAFPASNIGHSASGRTPKQCASAGQEFASGAIGRRLNLGITGPTKSLAQVGVVCGMEISAERPPRSLRPRRMSPP